MTTTQKTTDVTARQRSHWWWTVPGCLAMVLLNAAVSYAIVRLNTPVTVAFNMKQTVDAFFDSASQKKLSEAQSKALADRFNAALEASLQTWQQKHHAVILVSPAVPGIGRTEKYSSRLFDPSVRLAADIRDNEGRIFARQGEVMNPLQYVPFNQTLYFINGDDPEQIEWMKRQTPPTLESKIILVQGSIPEMQKALDSRVYFDQNGVICQRLGIDQVPARVSAVSGDRFLKVEFIPVGEGGK
ncbi:TPA: type-F conjugative transfer system protein TrbI [Escherichia coli]|nr:type-F conjugative transfer system protein TrbI [Escherichia coli]